MIKSIFLILLFPMILQAKTIRIAVMDAGLNPNLNIKKCATGHKDFTGQGFDNDSYQHGSNISSIIEQINKDNDYCQIIIKVFDATYQAIDYIQIWKYVLELNPDIINYSGGSTSYVNHESEYIKKILNKKIIFITAAGNENSNLDRRCNYYPACFDKRIIVVGNLLDKTHMNPSSSYGTKVIDHWVIGTNIKAGGVTLTGTSQAAAIVSAAYVKYLCKVRSK